MQILAEGSERFSQLLIEAKAHENLFEILETEQNTREYMEGIHGSMYPDKMPTGLKASRPEPTS